MFCIEEPDVQIQEPDGVVHESISPSAKPLHHRRSWCISTASFLLSRKERFEIGFDPIHEIWFHRHGLEHGGRRSPASGFISGSSSRSRFSSPFDSRSFSCSLSLSFSIKILSSSSSSLSRNTRNSKPFDFCNFWICAYQTNSKTTQQ